MNDKMNDKKFKGILTQKRFAYRGWSNFSNEPFFKDSKGTPCLCTDWYYQIQHEATRHEASKIDISLDLKSLNKSDIKAFSLDYTCECHLDQIAQYLIDSQLSQEIPLNTSVYVRACRENPMLWRLKIFYHEEDRSNASYEGSIYLQNGELFLHNNQSLFFQRKELVWWINWLIKLVVYRKNRLAHLAHLLILLSLILVFGMTQGCYLYAGFIVLLQVCF